MKKIFLVIFCVMCVLPAYVNATVVCPDELGTLPILSHGRVKPLVVHAKEALRFITGKLKSQKTSALQTYCELSLSEFFSDNTVSDFGIKVEHLQTKAFLGISDDAKTVSYLLVSEKFKSMLNYLYQLQTNQADKSVIQDFKAVLNRYELYQQIIQGQDWKIFQNSEWVLLRDFVQSKDETRLFSALLETAKKYQEQDNSYLIEYYYDKSHLLHWAILMSLVSLILLLVSRKINHKAFFISVLLLVGLQIATIIFRGLISGRAPIANMYETVLWVGFGALIFAMILARLRKERLFLFFGLLINFICLFMMIFGVNMLDPSIKPLVPVLRDNFWLATHVSSITISYAILSLSWMISIYFMIKTILNRSKQEDVLYFNLLAYDCLKIGVVLLALGILLGAVWADYSWGRFWGWDPKETWSLIALLTYMAVLHARYAGWLSPRFFLFFVGIAFNTIIMAWFGVNYVLASGLHSYGFSSGGTVFLVLLTFVQAVIFALYSFKQKTKTSLIPNSKK